MARGLSRFPEKTRVNESHTHDLSKLLRLAGLEQKLDAAARASPALALNWAVVKDWKETTRYDATIEMKDARVLYKAVTVRRVGVMEWLRQHW